MNTTLYTLLFCISLTITYLVARSGRVSLAHVTLVGILFNTLTFFMYAMSRQHFVVQAALTGIQLSVIFTLSCVGLAYVFRALKTVEPSKQRLDAINDTLAGLLNIS